VKKLPSTSLILSLFIFTIIMLPSFFLKEEPALFVARSSWSLIIASSAYLIFSKGEISKYRAILFVILAWAFLFQFKFKAPQFQETPYCHIAIVGTFLNFMHSQYLSLVGGRWHIFGVLSLGFLWLAVTLILGQAWCSWACFYGGFDDGFSKIIKKPLLKFKLPNKLRDFPIAFTIFIILISFTAAVPIFCIWVCPLKTTTQFFDADVFIRYIQTAIFLFVTAFFLVILPLVIKKRTFCSFLCPFGAWQSIFGSVNPFRVSIDANKCIKCKACIEKCPMFAINEESLNQNKILNYCNRCGKCIDICPVQAINITLRGKNIKCSDKVPQILREILDARVFFIVSCLLILGAISNLFVPQAMIKLIKILFGV